MNIWISESNNLYYIFSNFPIIENKLPKTLIEKATRKVFRQ
ncbi:MAG: hypothetical protein QG646_1994 [Euryarchaeota archaeon]|nr:hypothetical protein [Euryarchaeota archaeon]